ncbi:MAG: hypothetical protein ACOC1F_10345, partial [Myxococcota bacterium]
MTRTRVVLVAKHTTYREFVEHRRDADTLRLLSGRDLTVADIKKSHDEHQATLAVVMDTLRELGARTQVV